MMALGKCLIAVFLVITLLRICGCHQLVCAQESGNPHDTYAVTMKKGSMVAGYIARAVCLLSYGLYKAITATACKDSHKHPDDLP